MTNPRRPDTLHLTPKTHMKIEFFSQGGNGEFPWDMFIFWILVWLFILSRPDLDTAARILWAMVVIFVPIFGVFFYWFLAPTQVTAQVRRPSGSITTGSDVAGTPWEGNPHHTQE